MKKNELTGTMDALKALSKSGDLKNYGIQRVPDQMAGNKSGKEHDRLTLIFPSGKLLVIEAFDSDLECSWNDPQPKRLKKNTQVYYDCFVSRENMIEQFEIQESDLDGYEVLYAAYDQADYQGDAFVILRKGGDLFEVNSSHCSCNGLSWKVEPTTLNALMFRPNVPEKAKDNLKEAFASLISFI